MTKYNNSKIDDSNTTRIDIDNIILVNATASSTSKITPVGAFSSSNYQVV